jgi:hypothetical protein
MGRFMSPDWSATPDAVPYASLSNPQTLNLYSYAGNNPLSKTDPDGHCTNGGAQKGFWWCLFNDSDQDAAQARQQLAQYKNVSINGKTPADAAKGLSNTQTVQLERSVFNYISSQAMSTPGMMIGLAIVPGAAEEVVPAEAGEFVNLADQTATTHILEGDATGGGHAPGLGIPGKSEFPAGWSNDRIMHEISDVATDPASRVTTQGRTTIIQGTRDGVNIKVVMRDGRIVTGYPTNVPRNP